MIDSSRHPSNLHPSLTSRRLLVANSQQLSAHQATSLLPARGWRTSMHSSEQTRAITIPSYTCLDPARRVSPTSKDGMAPPVSEETLCLSRSGNWTSWPPLAHADGRLVRAWTASHGSTKAVAFRVEIADSPMTDAACPSQSQHLRSASHATTVAGRLGTQGARTIHATDVAPGPSAPLGTFPPAPNHLDGTQTDSYDQQRNLY